MKHTSINVWAYCALIVFAVLTPVNVLAEVKTYTDIVNQYNPVWYMGLNDATGSTTAATTGQNKNTATATAVTFQSSGVIGTGAYFNGNTSKIQLTETDHSVWSKQSTVECWIKASDLYKNLEIVGYNKTNGNCRAIYTNDDGTIGFYEWNGTTNYISSPSALQTDEWVYIVGTANTSTQKEALYVNGVKVAEKSIGTGDIWNKSTEWTIGNKDLDSPRGSSGVSVKGTLDELAVYNTALPQSAVLTKYQVATNQVLEKSLMTGATVTASEQYDDRFGGSNVKDGIINDITSEDNYQGYWIAQNGTNGAYLTVDLGSTHTIDKIDLQNCRNGAHGDSGTKDFTLYYSTDGSNWTKILSSTLTTALEQTVMPIQSFTFDAVDARYVKFVADSYITGKERAGLNEMWIFETSKNWQLGTDLSKDWTIDGTKKTGAEFTEANSNTGTVLANHTGTVTLNADATFNITGDRVLTQSGAITGTGTLTKTGTGTLELKNTIEAGALDIQEGTVSFTTATTASNMKTIDIANGAKALFTNIGVKNSNTDTVITIEEGGTLQFDSNITGDDSYNYIGISSGTKSLTIQGDGTILKTGSGHQWLADNQGGTTYIALSSKGCIDIQEGKIHNGGWGHYDWTNNYGQLKLSNGGMFVLWDSNPAEIGGLIGESGTLIFAASGGNGTLIFGKGITDSTITYEYNGSISVDQTRRRTFQKIGAGTQTFGGSISGNADIDVQAGTLKITGAITSIGNGTINVAEGADLVFDRSTNNKLKFVAGNVFSGTGTVTLKGAGQVDITNNDSDYWMCDTKTSTFTGTYILDKSRLYSNGGKLGGDGVNIDIRDLSSLLLSNNTVNANITMTGKGIYEKQGTQYGALRLENSNLSGTLTLSGDALLTNHGSGKTVTISSTVDLKDKALTVQQVSDQDIVFDGKISGEGGSLVLKGNSTKSLILSQAPEYTGSTTIESGTLKLSAGGTLYNLSGGSVDSTGKVTTAVTVDASGQDLILSNSQTTKFVGNLSAKTLEKIGTGTLELIPSAIGSIKVDTFRMTAGRTNIAEDISGNLELLDGATLSPCAAVGEVTSDGQIQLIVDGNASFGEGSTLLLDGDDSGFEQLIMSDGHEVTFESTSDGKAIIDLVSDNIQWGASYMIIQNGKDFTGEQATNSFWNSLLSPASDYYWNLSVSGNQVFASIDPNAVPEPSTWALLILGTAGLMWLRKRK